MTLRTRARVTVFILAFLVWLALTAKGGIQEIVSGLVVAILVSLVGGRFVFAEPPPAKRGLVRRLWKAFLYIWRFLWEMIKANVHVASIVLRPTCPVKPGIVKIRTGLTRDVALTILANSISLTPGTFTVDVDPEKKELYIHCIEVKSTDLEENTKAIGQRFEPLLTEVFE